MESVEKKKKTRKARLDGWIASFDLLEFLVNSLTALSTRFGWRGEKHIAISINHMRIMQSVTNKGYESIGMLNFSNTEFPLAGVPVSAAENGNR